MCKMIFIGTAEQIDERPFDEKSPSFYLQRPTEEEIAVLKNFRKPFVYSVGTHRGCSCDFISYSNISDEEYRNERLALATVIDNQLTKGKEVEVYCCWAGDYEADKEERTEKPFVPNLQGFYINERELIVYSGIDPTAIR